MPKAVLRTGYFDIVGIALSKTRRVLHFATSDRQQYGRKNANKKCEAIVALAQQPGGC